MKKNIKIITILAVLFSAFIVILQGFQKEKQDNGLKTIKNQHSSDGQVLPKKVLKKIGNNSMMSSFPLQNKLSSLHNNTNNSKAKKSPFSENTNNYKAKKNSFTKNTNDYIPVISLDDQVDLSDSTKKLLRDRTKKMKEQGFIEADDYSVYKSSIEALSIKNLGSRSLQDVYDKLIFEPTSVNGSNFDQGEYLGHTIGIGLLKDESIHSSPEDFDALLLAPEHYEKEQERMGEFSRYFEFSELGNVKLTERFFPKDGNSVITPELMNADVNGSYAYYLAQRGSTGEILHFITWIKEDRQYIIESLNTGNLVSDIFKQKILNLANSIAENQGNN
ncbi:hypothetical protein [methanotrophic endosymbiont of Bathymodiolus puteoserpentis (Logatchev)]|jgi:hypothetical protein|uniref:hypothetical protein n=1 Tax=methanotrophic endosymbiont of Bathymodiolus puteoserpentis (Logatchev) TaxID=343235 RepID=UPI0013CADEB7|nr:hypothetical protein [methanotrophic endosymbiont of Bathymodiolus puteoserpentis (Logatchev)]SHE22504.1 hypothetical protein BPUTEOMOX_1405 [methanotrophic endosymbiont of Bathymodiolus puteoserpentis (Logatchev)]